MAPCTDYGTEYLTLFSFLTSNGWKKEEAKGEKYYKGYYWVSPPQRKPKLYFKKINVAYRCAVLDLEMGRCGCGRVEHDTD